MPVVMAEAYGHILARCLARRHVVERERGNRRARWLCQLALDAEAGLRIGSGVRDAEGQGAAWIDDLRLVVRSDGDTIQVLHAAPFHRAGTRDGAVADVGRGEFHGSSVPTVHCRVGNAHLRRHVRIYLAPRRVSNRTAGDLAATGRGQIVGGLDVAGVGHTEGRVVAPGVHWDGGRGRDGGRVAVQAPRLPCRRRSTDRSR